MRPASAAEISLCIEDRVPRGVCGHRAHRV